jgi:hypothetical protein
MADRDGGRAARNWSRHERGDVNEWRGDFSPAADLLAFIPELASVDTPYARCHDFKQVAVLIMEVEHLGPIFPSLPQLNWDAMFCQPVFPCCQVRPSYPKGNMNCTRHIAIRAGDGLDISRSAAVPGDLGFNMIVDVSILIQCNRSICMNGYDYWRELSPVSRNQCLDGRASLRRPPWQVRWGRFSC